MPEGLDPFIARLIDRPDRLPTWTRHPWAAIADAGDLAHRRALDRWSHVREHGNVQAIAGVAVLLAEAFDDERAMLALAQSVDRETLFEAVLPYAGIMTPGARCARLLEKLFVTRLLHELSRGLLRIDLVEALTRLRVDDGGEAYLPARRALADEGDGRPSDDAVERFADRLLLAAATATPDRPEVAQTVLSYWGEAEPLDAVPTAEPVADAAPASWRATCALIAGMSRPANAERLITLAHDTDFWRSSSSTGPAADDARCYVDALERTNADAAEDRLLDIAKADVAVSGRAVAAIARRRTRIAGAAPITRPRTDAVTAALIDAGALPAAPGPLGRRLIDDEAAADHSPLDLAAIVLGASGFALTFDLAPVSGSLAAHVSRSLRAVALAAGLRTTPFEVEDHDTIGAGVEVHNHDTGQHAVFTDGRMSAAGFDALVPDKPDDRGRVLRRIRIDADRVTYAMVEPDAWSAYLDWAVTSPLPDTAPVPARRTAARPGEGGLLGRLFGLR